ncbi:MAG: transaldolase [Proteobacteria bacterium]|nr:transaldolase [Pseudomonadota bacterium]
MKAADLRVKIFADGADLDVIRRRAADPMISGFTTNPSLARKAGVTDYERFSRAALAAAGTRPVSIEVVADSADEIAAQALRISQWAPNAYVKIPVTTTSGTSLIGVAGRLSHEGVKVNLTAILTLRHVAEAVDAFRGGAPSVISADAGVDPVGHMRAALAICRSADRAIELLWASPRELFNVVQASQVGVDIITVTDSLLEKLSQLGRDLGEVSLDTVRMLKADADMGGLRL